MRRNHLLEKMKQGGAPALNGWLSMASTYAAELLAHQAWDSLTIDMQHGVNDYAVTVEMLRAISVTQVTPIVRVPWNEPGIVQKVLDAGALGVIAPMINSREECEALVSVCNYAPKGTRSFGPVRANVVHGADYYKHANDNILSFAMIETRKALAAVDEIASVPGLSGLYIGPADLSLSLGFDPISQQMHPEVIKAIEQIKAAADRAGIFTFMHCVSLEQSKAMFDRGFSAMTMFSDARLLSMGCQQAFQNVGVDMTPKAGY